MFFDLIPLTCLFCLNVFIDFTVSFKHFRLNFSWPPRPSSSSFSPDNLMTCKTQVVTLSARGWQRQIFVGGTGPNATNFSDSYFSSSVEELNRKKQTWFCTKFRCCQIFTRHLSLYIFRGKMKSEKDHLRIWGRLFRSLCEGNGTTPVWIVSNALSSICCTNMWFVICTFNTINSHTWR